MKQGIFTIVENGKIAADVFRMTLSGDTSALRRPGQFVDVALDGFFLRRPFAATEWTDNSLTIIYKTVGNGTQQMAAMKAGQTLGILTGLGNGFDPEACRTRALVICGGLGASPVYSLVKELIAKGRKVTVVAGFNAAGDVFLADEFRRLGAELYITTLDGSYGTKGLVTDVIKTLTSGDFDYFYCCGPLPMMKAVNPLLDFDGEYSLEERMGCGCGICYGCTCHTSDGPRRICADGPVFKKDKVLW